MTLNSMSKDVYSYVTCVVMVQLQLKEHLHHDEAAT